MALDERAREAARIIWSAWQAGSTIDRLPETCRPRDLAEGYAAQAMLERVSGDAHVGWKLAATNVAGQRHIGVDAPIAGRLFASRVHGSGARLAMGANRMRVAEAEFAFVLERDLPARAAPYSPEEAMAAVGELRPAIELPDSRLADFATAGAAQLAADDACAHLLVLGPAAPPGWRERDLASHPVCLRIGGALACEGRGSDVLGGPALALAWLASSHALLGEALAAAQIVTTGVCGRPVAVRPGDHVTADFGILGSVEVRLDDR